MPTIIENHHYHHHRHHAHDPVGAAVVRCCPAPSKFGLPAQGEQFWGHIHIQYISSIHDLYTTCTALTLYNQTDSSQNFLHCIANAYNYPFLFQKSMLHMKCCMYLYSAILGVSFICFRNWANSKQILIALTANISQIENSF